MCRWWLSWCVLRLSQSLMIPAPDVSRDVIIRGLAVPIAGVGAFRGSAALALAASPRMPLLQGEFKNVGVLECRTQECRVKVFYPTSESVGHEEGFYMTPAASEGIARMVGFHKVGLGFLLDHLGRAPGGYRQNASPIDSTCPLLVYSHGFGGNYEMSTHLFRQMASHGFVVAAVEHADGTASRTVLADGTTREFGSFMQDSQRRRSQDLLDVAELVKDNIRGLPPLGDLFFGGHSYGGPSALLASQQNTDVRGIILHDPAIRASEAARLSQATSTISFVSDQYGAAGVRCGTTYACQGSCHGNFVDAPMWAPPWVMEPLSKVFIPAAGPCEPAILHNELAKVAKSFSKDPASFCSTSSSDSPLTLRPLESERIPNSPQKLYA